MAAYAAALAGEVPRREIGAARTKPGTVSAAVTSFFNSAAFQMGAQDTRRPRRNILERFRAEHGDRRIALLEQRHIARMVAAKAETPSAARNFLNTLRALMHHCMIEGMCGGDPTQGVKSPTIKTDGYRTWDEADIAIYEAKHPIGSRAPDARPATLYRPAPVGRCSARPSAHLRRVAALAPAEDRHDTDHSRAPRTRRRPRSDAERSSDVFDHRDRQTVFGGGLHQLVSRNVQ